MTDRPRGTPERIRSLPELSANFVPLPEALLEVLIGGSLTRGELLVILHLARVTFAFDRDGGFVGVDAVARATGLSPAAAEEALSQTIERGLVLPFRTEGAGRFYLLNTDDNRRRAGLAPEARAAAPRAGAPETGRGDPAARTPLPAMGTPARALPRSLSRHVLERIVGVVGRDLTRDETERLSDLGASEDLLLRAIDNLVAKNVEVYSSDLVIYEYESLASAEKRRGDEVRKREANEAAKVKSRACKKCNGLGYSFIGANTIKECDCRKTP